LNKQPAVAQPDAKLPVGDAVSAQVLSLPMHQGLSLASQQLVADALRGV
jgi:UDP-2-acetamido-2-deoxy-ribo-hexuluronate aminotransferase